MFGKGHLKTNLKSSTVIMYEMGTRTVVSILGYCKVLIII